MKKLILALLFAAVIFSVPVAAPFLGKLTNTLLTPGNSRTLSTIPYKPIDSSREHLELSIRMHLAATQLAQTNSSRTTMIAFGISNKIFSHVDYTEHTYVKAPRSFIDELGEYPFPVRSVSEPIASGEHPSVHYFHVGEWINDSTVSVNYGHFGWWQGTTKIPEQHVKNRRYAYERGEWVLKSPGKSDCYMWR